MFKKCLKKIHCFKELIAHCHIHINVTLTLTEHFWGVWENLTYSYCRILSRTSSYQTSNSCTHITSPTKHRCARMRAWSILCVMNMKRQWLVQKSKEKWESEWLLWRETGSSWSVAKTTRISPAPLALSCAADSFSKRSELHPTWITTNLAQIIIYIIAFLSKYTRFMW